MEKPRETDVLSHHPSQPSIRNLAEDPISKGQGMEEAIITRSSLAVIKLSGNTTCRVERAKSEPNQRNVVVFENAVDHACNTPPFHHPLNP